MREAEVTEERKAALLCAQQVVSDERKYRCFGQKDSLVGSFFALIPINSATGDPVSERGLFFIRQFRAAHRHRARFNHLEQRRIRVAGDHSFRREQSLAVEHEDVFSRYAVFAVTLKASLLEYVASAPRP